MTVYAPILRKEFAASEGRECNRCGENKKWSEFDRKTGGLNGYDSRCKVCISKVRNLKKQKKKQMYSRASKFNFSVTGEFESERVAAFSKIVATSLMQMLERGLIK